MTLVILFVLFIFLGLITRLCLCRTQLIQIRGGRRAGNLHLNDNKFTKNKIEDIIQDLMEHEQEFKKEIREAVLQKTQ